MSDVYNIRSRIERLGRSIAFLLIICLCVFAVRNVVKVNCAKIELFEVGFVGDAISDLASFFPIMLLALSFLHCICVGYRVGRGYIVSSFAAFTWHLSCQLFHSEMKSGIISVLCFSHGILLVSLVYAVVMIAALICVVFRVRHYCILAMLAVLFIILMFAVFDTKPPQGGQSSPPVINSKAPQPLRHKLTSSPAERSISRPEGVSAHAALVYWRFPTFSGMKTAITPVNKG